MKIEIWSDYMCPFCYIGKRRLEGALEKFTHSGEVQIIFKSFELEPQAPKDSNKPMIEHLAEKYGITAEQAKQMVNNVMIQAKTAGLNFTFDGMKLTNTFDIHRLTKWAKEKGKDKEFTEKVFHAYFVENARIGNNEVLLQLASEAGLEKEEAKAVLDSDLYAKEVHQDEFEAKALNVRGVPFFVINRKYALSGAQPEDVFLEVLQKIWEEEEKQPAIKTVASNDESLQCSNEGCNIEKTNN